MSSANEPLDTSSSRFTQAAEQSFNRVLPDMMALAASDLLSVNVNVQEAAMVALGVAEVLREPKVAEAFASVPQSMLPIEVVSRMPDRARALWYARVRVLAARPSFNGRRVPTEVAQEASDVRARMLRMATYHLPDNAEVADIAKGSGYQDQASDISRLIELFAQHEDILARDPYYDPAIVEQADVALTKLHMALAPKDAADHALCVDHQARAYTLVRKDYDLVREVAALLFRDDTATLAKFPSLWTTRAPRRKMRAEAASEVDTEVAAVAAQA